MKTKERYKKYGWIFRISMVLILAILVSIFLIPDRKIPINNVPTIEKNSRSYLDTDTLKENITQKIQTSIDSGNVIQIFWVMFYAGYGLDKLCYEVIDNPSDMNVLIKDSLGNQYQIKHKKCFNIAEPIPDLKFEAEISIPSLKEQEQPVNKSECIYFLNESYPCEINGQIFTCHSCLTQWSLDNAQSQTLYTPTVFLYVEADWFHKAIKFILIFILTGIVCWNITRVWVLIRDGIPQNKKNTNGK